MSRKWMLRVSVAALVASALVGTATIASAEANTDHIWAGEQLVGGAYQTSTNGLYRLIQQADGNLVEYKKASNGKYTDFVWGTGTSGYPGATTFVQKDGNLVVRRNSKADSTPIWSSNTASSNVSHLTVQTDGNVVLYTKDKQALWASQGLSSPARKVGDDYPTKWQNVAFPNRTPDSWGQYVRYCTSFVAWRLHDRNGYDLPRWQGNANSWDDYFRSKMDNKPRVGAVAQTDDSPGGNGHVAWVSDVRGSQVLLEEYNWNTAGGWGWRWADAGKYNYIHLNN